METSKLLQALKAFTKEEMKGLKKFLNLPSRKNNLDIRNCISLFKIVEAQHPHFESPKLKKEKVFKKLYPAQSYNVDRLDKQMSRLFALVQEFIILQYATDRKELHELLILSSFYQNRGQYGLAEITIKKYKKNLQKNDQQDSTYLYDVFLIEKQLVNDKALLNDSKRVFNFYKALDNLDQYYIFEKLELACRVLAINRFLLPVDLKKSLIILEHLSPLLESDFFDSPIIKVFYKAYLFLSGESKEVDEKFLNFEKALAHYHTLIPKAQAITLHTIIRNYYISQHHEGKAGFLEKSFYVYKDHLEKGYLYDKKYLFASTMINMVVSGLRLKQFDWVLKFIKDHEHKITGTTTPEDVYKLNLANYYFYTVEYDKALNYLSDNYDDIYLKLRTKRMEIKIYYETEHVLLAPKMDAFKIYIYRLSSNITKKQKVANRDFIDLLKQIRLPRTLKNEKRITKLRDKIKHSKYLPEKEWLLEKLAGLG